MQACCSPRALATVLVAAFASAALAQDLKMPKVELDYDKEVDFSAFKSYSWKYPLAAAKEE